MKPIATASLCLAFALLTFIQFPGHTWLQQDTQIYAPILEHLRDPSVLRNEIVVEQPHLAYSLYDEVALGLRALTGLGFRELLTAQQIVTRALGIWGLLLLAQSLIPRPRDPMLQGNRSLTHAAPIRATTVRKW